MTATLAVPSTALPAGQQPRWRRHPAYSGVVSQLAAAPPLVDYADVARLHRKLAAVSAGRAVVLQVGDCAERFEECTPAHVDQKLATLEQLAARLELRLGGEVVRVARIGGQFAKPRSRPVERVNGSYLPAFRGHLVNSEHRSWRARCHDPTRMQTGYTLAAQVHRRLVDSSAAASRWSSHEALVLDYEGGLVRTDPHSGRAYLSSTHFPWIGERTRQPDGAHAALAASIANPVGCKVGPTATPAEVAQLCARLDPDRVPGRLTLIIRMGRDRIEQVLPPIVAAVRRAGHPVVWLSDPMHGNTVCTTDGYKTRHLRHIEREAATFSRILNRFGEHPGGLHLEVAATEVTECVGGPVAAESMVPQRYQTLCDPRLGPDQARTVIDGWAGEPATRRRYPARSDRDRR